MAYPITAWGGLGRKRTPPLPGYKPTNMGSTGAAATVPPPPGGNFAGGSTAWGGAVRSHPSALPPAPGNHNPTPLPTTPAGGHAVPPAPPQPDWAALIHADPRWLAAAPGFASRRGQAYSQYGFAPDAAGNLQVDTTNPYSVAGADSIQLGNESENAQNAANARGILFSGAQVGAQQAAQNHYQQNLFNALKALQGILGGVSTDESNLYGTIYGDLKSTLPPSGRAS